MARLRSIKPEFFTSSQICECSREARLVFIGLWCFADDSGIHPADPRRLKNEVFPSDDGITRAKIEGWINELICAKDRQGSGLVEEYEVASQKWWRVTGWKKHQIIRFPSYRYPLPDGTIPQIKGSYSKNTGGLPQDNSSLTDTKLNETKQEETNTFVSFVRPSVRPFVASDHLEVWPEARRIANETARRLWPERRHAPKAEDQQLLLVAAFLSRTLLSEAWLTGGIDGTLRKNRRSPIAYLKTVLGETARKRGHDLNELLDAIEIPKVPMRPPPDEKADVDPKHIGDMPKEG